MSRPNLNNQASHLSCLVRCIKALHIIKLIITPVEYSSLNPALVMMTHYIRTLEVRLSNRAVIWESRPPRSFSVCHR